MEIATLEAELERLFDLAGLLDVSENVLGFPPQAVGGTATIGSFAKSLIQYCVANDGVEALCEAVRSLRPDASAALDAVRVLGIAENETLRPNSTLGDVTVVRSLGQGRVSESYLGQYANAPVRVKLLRREAMRDRRGLQRFAAVTRLVGKLSHPGLPSQLLIASHGERVFSLHRFVEGPSLAHRVARSGPIHVSEAKPLILAILDALAALHERRIVHGALSLENVIVPEGAIPGHEILLLDAGTDRLRAAPRNPAEVPGFVQSPKGIAPELLSSMAGTPASDMYALGALLYEMLTGRAPFEASGFDLLSAHRSEIPEPPSAVGPRGWIDRGLDDFVLTLLAKDPAERPAHAHAATTRFQSLGHFSSFRPTATIDPEEFNRRLEALGWEPTSLTAAEAVERAVDEGADPERAAEAIRRAAFEIGDDAEAQHRWIKKELLLRAAQLYDRTLRDPANAEQLYLWVLNTDPSDNDARTALERIRRNLGKFEELIEMLLDRGQRSESRVERGRAFAEIGRIYQNDVGDAEQALVAFTQALCEDISDDTYADEVERLAGSNPQAWAEVLESCNGPLEDQSFDSADKTRFILRVGRWYSDKAGRADMALTCLSSVVASDPTNEAVLESMVQLYRKGQQWPELGMVLTRWAESTSTPAKARDLRAEAAEVAERHLNDPAGARTLFEAVLADDPMHERAAEGLARVLEKQGEFAALAKLLSSQAEGLRGEARVRAQLRLSDAYEISLHNDAEAIRVLEQGLSEAPEALELMKGLDRLYAKVGRFEDLIAILDREVRVSTTPRQKALLLERIAAIHEEEFLDNERAAAALRAVLTLDENNDNALSRLTRICRAMDRWAEVADLLERQLALSSETPRVVSLTLQLGRVLAEQLGAPDRAMTCFEQVLSFEPQHPEALEMVARLRESLGDADAALAAIDVLASKATTPQAKAEHYLRAARMLEQRGDIDLAISHYKMALDAQPTQPGVAAQLRQAYLARGDAHAAVQLLEQEIKRTEGERAKAKLHGELASIALNRLHDGSRAEDAAKTALSLDPTSAEALTVLGDIAFESQRFIESSKHYTALIDRIENLPIESAVPVLRRAIESLAQSGSLDRAQSAYESLVRLAPNDQSALITAARMLFDHKGDPAKVAEEHRALLARFGEALGPTSRAELLYRLGESLRRADNPASAINPLEEAVDLDPSYADPLTALASAYTSLARWSDVQKTLTRHLDVAFGDDRIQILIDLGDVTATRLGDRPRAIQSLVAALDDRPDDRRLLTKLMQLYSDEKDWTRLVEVVVRLAGFVDEHKQRAKYLHTAAIVTARQMGDVERALDFFEEVIELDPTIQKALNEAVELYQSRGNYPAVERLLRKRLDVVTEAKDQKGQIETHLMLAELYEKRLGWLDHAISALEAAAVLEPGNAERTLQIAAICSTDPVKYLTRALSAHHRLLEDNPYRVESYRAMRRLFTETKNPDGAWCLCQALSVLGFADPDEDRFYRRMRAETAAPAQAVFTEPDWAAVTPKTNDPWLSALFAIIEPAVIAARAPELRELGHDPKAAIDLAQTPAPMAQTLFYAAGVLGMQAPPCFVIRDDVGGLSFLHARSPGIGLGRVAMSSQVPPQAAAFIAARHLAFLRPGFYLRQLLGSATNLKAWLFAAIKLISPQFPVSPDTEGAVREAYSALDIGLRGSKRDELTRVVSTLLRDGAALDLKKWVMSVDLSADRVGFVLAHDLDTAVQVIRASDESASPVSGQDRIKELAVFSVSPEYFELRQRLQIGVDL